MNRLTAAASVAVLAGVLLTSGLAGESRAQTKTLATSFPVTAGTSLPRGAKLSSTSGGHVLVVGTDGNLVVTDKGGKYVWGLDQVITISQARPDRFEVGADGSFAGYNAQGTRVWWAPVTRLDPKATLDLSENGILQLATSSEVLWGSDGTTGPLLKTATSLPLTAGFVLKKEMKYSSPSGNFVIVFNQGGNLVLTTRGGDYLWGLDRVIRDFDRVRPNRVEIKPDGSFGAYNNKGVALWTPPLTKLVPGASLQLTDDGALQVTAGGEILWAHDGVLTPRIKVFLRKASLAACQETGWNRCVEMADPKIRIMSSRAVTDSAVNAVANVYYEMLSRLLPTASAPEPKRVFDGFKVYLTNDEPWEEQSKLPVVGTMWPDQTGPNSGRVLQGGASTRFLWISEQMIAKKGVKTRSADGAPDNTVRTFDQVIHEMAHSIDRNLVDDRTVAQFDGNGTPVESFAFRVQQWFGAPAGEIPARQEATLKGIFSSRAAFSTEGYGAAPSGTPLPMPASPPAATPAAPTPAPAPPAVGPSAPQGAGPAGTAQEGRFPIPADSTIVQGRKYMSESGNHFLRFQPDGNIVINTKDGRHVWGLNDLTPKYAQANNAAVQKDGNLVVSDANRGYIWSALHKDPDPSAFLTLSPEGVLRLVSGKTGASLWTSRDHLTPTGGVAATPAATPAAPANPGASATDFGEGVSAARGPNNTFRYVLYLGFKGANGGSGTTINFNRYAICPSRGPQVDFTVRADDESQVMTVAAARAAGLTAANEPCIIIPPTFPQFEKQYAIRGSDNSFQYAKAGRTRNGFTDFTACPGVGPRVGADSKSVVTVEAALAAKLKPLNAPCSTDSAPFGK